MLNFLAKEKYSFVIAIIVASGFLALFLFSPSHATASVKYINGTGAEYTSVTYPTVGATWGVGSDTTGDGSQNAPWATLGKALSLGVINKGDTIYVAGGNGFIYSEVNSILAVFNEGDGTTSIIGDGNVKFNMFIGSPSFLLNFGINADDVVWDNIDVVNTNSISGKFMFRMTNGRYLFKNSSFDFNNVTKNASMWLVAGSDSVQLSVQSSVVKNHPTFVVSNINSSTSSFVKFESCFFDNNDKLIWFNSNAVDTYIHNCTAINYKHGFFYPQVLGAYLEFTNNIFLTSPTNTMPIFRFDDAVEDWYVLHPEKFIFSNNILGVIPYGNFREIAYGSGVGNFLSNGDNYNNSSGVGDLFELYNTKNWMLEMSFTDPTSSIYSLSSTTDLANGRGDSTYLPTYDINGNAWSGNHIGAWPNLTTTTPVLAINSSSVSIVGDSVAYGMEADNTCPCQELTNYEGPACWFDYYDGGCDAGSTVYANTGTSFIDVGNPHPFDDVFDVMPGMRIQGLYFWVDQIMANYAPSTVFVYVGTNNLINNSIYPGETTEAQLSNIILLTMQKIEEWGATPVWLGPTGNSENQDRIREIDSLVATGCETNGWKYDSVFDRIQNFNATSTPYYVNSTAVHHNTLGAKFVGSVMENLYNNRSNYYVANSSVDSIIAGTYLHPLSVTDFNSATSIPTGEVGRTVMATGTLSTTLDTPSGGVVGKLLKLTGGSWTAGMVIDENYWLLENLVIVGENKINTSLNITGSNVVVNGVTIK